MRCASCGFRQSGAGAEVLRRMREPPAPGARSSSSVASTEVRTHRGQVLSVSVARPLTGQSAARDSSSLSLPHRLQPPVSYTPKHLAERIRAEQAALEARSGTDGERKTITALFADLKGSTALIEGLDPEEARAIIDPALQLMMDAVHRYEGYVAQALGDGIFALFGAPLAHEDHPSGHSMPRCACKRRCGAMATGPSQRVVTVADAGRDQYRRSGGALDPQR